MAVSNKIVFITAIPIHEDPRDFITSCCCRRSVMGDSKSAVVIRRMNTKLMINGKWCCIQRSEEAWGEFQEAVKRLLAIAEDDAIVLYGSDPPYYPVKDIFWILNQPTISMSIYVSCVKGSSKLPQKAATKLPKLSCVASNGKAAMSFNVAGLEAALAETRRLCREMHEEANCSGVSNDGEVDQLLALANSVLKGQRAPVSKPCKKNTSVPDVPSGLTVLPRSPCGVHVLWNPVRLDEFDQNHGQLIKGYVVYVNGEVKAHTDSHLSCQVILADLDEDKVHSIQVCTCGKLYESPPSKEVLYRPRRHLVDNEGRQSRTSSLHNSVMDQLVTSGSYNRDNEVLTAIDVNVQLDKDELCSQSSGIEADMPPHSISAKTGSSYYKENSPSSSGHSSLFDEHSFDGFLDGTPRLARHYHENKKRVQRSGPDPPLNIRVQPSPNGKHLVVSWTPVRRDANGCNNGCRVLGYRVYVNNLPVMSVDGPASFKTEIPHQTSNDFEVYLSTRSIAGESVHSKVVKNTLIRSYKSDSSILQHSTVNLQLPHCLTTSRDVLRTSPAPPRIETYV